MKKVKLKPKTIASIVFDRAMDWLIALSCVCIAFVMLTITADVILREFFNLPIEWVLEISELILPAIIFLGAAWVLKRDGHVTMDVVISRLSTKGQALLNTITSIIGVIICLLLARYGTLVTINHIQRKLVSVTPLELPTFPSYAVIAIGAFLLTIQFIRRSYGYTQSFRQSLQTIDN